jgi:D-amino peptidase
MKVFISIDIEGISGVFRDAQTDELGSDAHRGACDLMQGDLDAALAGCSDAGADEVVVCDAHYNGDNLGVAGLPANVSLISGSSPNLSMMEGIDDSFEAAMLVGYHAQAGTRAAVLAHTFTDSIARVTVLDPAGGAPYVTGEFGLCSAVAGAFGVPVVFASGDDKLAAEACALVPEVETAVTKEGLAEQGARLKAPEVARAEIRAGVARALTAAPRPAPLDWTGRPLQVTFTNSAYCDLAAGCPTVTRLDGTTVEIVAHDYLTTWKTFVAVATLSGS